MDIHKFLADLVREVGAMLIERYRMQTLQVRRKGDRSIVTDADLAADHQIVTALQAQFPDDGLLSEEGREITPSKSGNFWVIDPLDGTTNFSLELPIWGISIARVGPAGPDCAALYFPLLDELYLTARGEGASLNHEPISVKPYEKGQTAAFFSCCTRTHRRYDVRVPYKTRILGSAAYSFCAVARGTALIAFEATPKIWDIAGGWLLVQEAGGEIQTLGVPIPFPIDLSQDISTNLPTLAAADDQGLRNGRKWIVRRKGHEVP